jgi:hypothetical protein
VPEGTHLEVRCATELLESGRYRMHVETREGNHVGKRSMEAGSCGELASSAAVLVAILIDPDVASRKEPMERPVEALDAAQPTPTAAPTPIPAPTSNPKSTATSTPSSIPTIAAEAPRNATTVRSSARALVYDAGLLTGGVVGPLPIAAPGLGLQLGIDVAPMRFEVGGLAWLSTRATVDPAATQGADFQLLSFYGRACASFSTPRWWVGPCVGAEVDVLRGTGFGPGVTPHPNSASFGSVLVGGALRWRLSRSVAVPFQLEGIFSVGRPSFVFSGTDGTLVHQPASAGGRLTLGIEYRFR